MSIMVDVPPAMVEQTKEYEKAIGISLDRGVLDGRRIVARLPRVGEVSGGKYGESLR